MREYGSDQRGRRFRVIVGVVLALLLVIGGGVGYWLFRSGDPVQAEKNAVETGVKQLQAFAKAWQENKWQTASQLTDDPEPAASLLKSVHKNVNPSSLKVTVGKGSVTKSGDPKSPVTVVFDVRMKVPRVGDFAYQSKAQIIEEDGEQVVHFDAALIHPELKTGQTLAVAKMSTRGSVLDRNGGVLEAASLVGGVDEKTGVGTTGLQKRYDKELGGSGAATGSAYAVAVTDRESGKALKPLRSAGAQAGKDVRTTIDPVVQKAAAEALEGAKVPASIVAIQPSTGDILAVANRPGGFNRALVGKYPPGSTFKVVTAAALLESGLKPTDELECPKYEWVSGFRFANQDDFVLGKGSTFREAFARSCNTAFIKARGQLDDDSLAQAASAFGIGGEWDTGASTFDGSVPPNTDANDKAAAMIGQGRNLASPLVMASVAATVKAGKFHQPRLVPEAIRKPYQSPRSLEPQVVKDLRTMMGAVVTEGAGDALKGIAGGPHAKTGTAEFGTETPPRTHAWMIGYQESSDLAWAVLLEGGGSGGKDAGPVAAAFLNKAGG